MICSLHLAPDGFQTINEVQIGSKLNYQGLMNRRKRSLDTYRGLSAWFEMKHRRKPWIDSFVRFEQVRDQRTEARCERLDGLSLRR